MPSTSFGPALKQIHQLFAHGTTGGLSDAQLLERYETDQDAAAFEAIVQRHGPMVLAVCRGVLKDPNDAEDAFQAAFLVLVRKAGSIWATNGSLGSWLYRVAFRIAIQANAGAARRREVERRAGEMAAAVVRQGGQPADVIAALHQEIGRLPEKYRAPIVLCHLEQMTHGEAARQLGWTVGTVRGRVARARELLRARLTRRGVALSGGVLMAVLSEQAAPAAVPGGWVAGTVRVAMNLAAGRAAVAAVSATAIALRDGLLKTMFTAKLKWAAAVMLAMGTAAGLTAALAIGPTDDGKTSDGRTAAATRSRENIAMTNLEQDTQPVPITGRVVDSAGKPLAGATIYARHSHWGEVGQESEAVERVAAAGPDGRFRFDLDTARSDVAAGDGPAWHSALIAAAAPGHGPTWIAAGVAANRGAELRLVPDDLPIRGRIVDSQGRAVPNAIIRVKSLARTRDGVNLDALLASGKLDFDGHLVPTIMSPYWRSPIWIGRNGEVRTDGDGRFELRGLGRDLVAVLEIEGQNTEQAHIAVLDRAPRVPSAPRPRSSPTFDYVNGEIGLELYGTTFEHVVRPSKPITGVVRLRGTGRPVAAVIVAGQIPGRLWSVVMTATGNDGRYRLEGLPKAEAYSLGVRPTPGSPYLGVGRKAVTDTAGLQPIEVDFDLSRAVGVTGRLIDKQTGQAIPCEMVEYSPLPGNPIQQGSWGNCSGRDNTFRITVPPGRGMIALKVRGKSHPYPAARLAPADKGKIVVKGEDGAQFGFPLSMYNAYRFVDFREGVESATVDLEVTPGIRRKVELVGPDNRPVSGASAMGVTNDPFASLAIEGATFDVNGLRPGESRVVEIRHEGQGLAGSAAVNGSDPVDRPLIIKLDHCGIIAGRLIDEDDQPLRKAKVSAVVEHRRGTGASDPVFRDREAVTDNKGRFRIEGINPTLSVLIWIQDPNHPAPKYQSKPEKDLGGLSVKPGAVLELGDVRVRRHQINE